MVTKELIAELEKARDLFEWSLFPGDAPAAARERRKKPRLLVRGKLKKHPEQVMLDPIGAVCFSKTGIMFSEHYWVEAALTIGLAIDDARDIIAAANDMTWRNVGNVRRPDPHRQGLRECLLDATRPLAEAKVGS